MKKVQATATQTVEDQTAKTQEAETQNHPSSSAPNLPETIINPEEIKEEPVEFDL